MLASQAPSPPNKHLYVLPTAADMAGPGMAHEVHPCQAETLACQQDREGEKLCGRFIHEKIEGANMDDCQRDPLCKAMVDCAMGQALHGRPPPPPPPPRSKEPAGNNPCGVPVRHTTTPLRHLFAHA